MAQDHLAKPRRRIWRVALPLLLLAVIAFWWFSSRIDRRFLGTWEPASEGDTSTMQPFELRGDGMGDLITPNERLPIRWWYDGASVCMQAAKASVIGQLIESFQVAVGMRPDYTVRLYVVNIDDSRFQYIKVARGRTEPEPGAETYTLVRRLK